MTNLQRLINNVRFEMPDRTEGDDPHLDGRAISLAQILSWVNDAGDIICGKSNVIRDWYAIPSVSGQDVYELPEHITSAEQVLYNLLPLDRSPEYDNLFTVKRSGSAWWFSPHATNIIPALYVMPAPSESAAATQLDGSLSDTATSMTVDSTTGFNPYGYVKVGDEIIRYSTVGSATALTNLVRGQAGTKAEAHANNDAAVDQNIIMNVFRLPVHVVDADSRLEIPRSLHPLLELYVMAKFVGSEQDKQAGAQMLQMFMGLVDQLADRPATRGLRQGIQVKTWPNGGTAANVRVYMP